MKGMKLGFAALALAALLGVCAVGCNKSDKQSQNINSPSQPTVTANNAPIDSNAPITNNAPTANSGAANNAPETKPPVKKPEPKPSFDEPKGPGEDKAWKKNAISARKLTESVDMKMKSVKDSRMHLFLNVDLPTAGKGFFEDDCIIADQSRFYLNYAVFVPGRRGSFDTFLVTKLKGDKEYSTYVGGKYQLGRIEPGKDVLSGWVTNSTHYLASGVGTSKKPFTELLDAAQKANWKIDVEDKKFDKGTFRRVIMESRTVPKERFEIMIHPQKLLPVSFFAVIFDKKKTLSVLEISWAKSDKPLTEADLNPMKEVPKVKTLTPEEAARQATKIGS